MLVLASGWTAGSPIRAMNRRPHALDRLNSSAARRPPTSGPSQGGRTHSLMPEGC